jgi:hypothetical protein
VARHGLWKNRIIGPFFFHNTATGENYLDVVRNEGFPVILSEQGRISGMVPSKMANIIITAVQSENGWMNSSLNIVL